MTDVMFILPVDKKNVHYDHHNYCHNHHDEGMMFHDKLTPLHHCIP